MKTRLITTFLILSAAGFSTVSTQEIQPDVVQEGRIWNFYQGAYYQWTGRNLGMFFGADTVIDGKTYKNVLYRRVFYWDNFDELPVYDWGCALREEGARVYHYDYERKEERLMLDFSLKPGDTVETYSKFVVSSVGFTEGSIPLRYIELEGISEAFELGCGDRWIEKIGSKKNGIAWNDCWCCVGAINVLACCKEMNEEKPFYTYTEYPYDCLNAEYITVKGEIAFVPLSSTDSSTVLAVIDNPYEDEHATKHTTLMRNSTPFAQRLIVDGVEYLAGDNVEITGWLSSDWHYSDLEILSIRRTELSVQPAQEARLKLTPNPAKETITISASGCSLQRVEILDANGRILYAATLNNPDSFRYNVAWMPSGIYLVRVKTPCGVLTEKFSVK